MLLEIGEGVRIFVPSYIRQPLKISLQKLITVGAQADYSARAPLVVLAVLTALKGTAEIIPGISRLIHPGVGIQSLTGIREK
jgi:hypothetical protein